MTKSKSRLFSVSHLTFLALMIAFTHVSRLAFGFLPNVQPVTVIVILITLHFGVKEGLLVSTLSLILSNFHLGMGPWTLMQVGAYSLIVFLTSFLRTYFKSPTPPWLIGSLFSGLMGYLYGGVLALFHGVLFSLNTEALLVYWIAGLSFDSFHAVGNVAFYLLLYPTLGPLFIKVKRKSSLE